MRALVVRAVLLDGDDAAVLAGHGRRLDHMAADNGAHIAEH
jgi:hypothetical protein